jgi:L-threonylcarbamoyladenylate synthase
MWVDLASPDMDVIAEATSIIQTGGVVLYPSDTIYGMGCDPFHSEAVSKIFALKRRSREKGLLVLVPDAVWMKQLAEEVPPVANYLADRFWPGPLTLLLRSKTSMPSAVVGSSKRIGVRCPDSKFLLLWLEALSGPIVSTSANISGLPVPKDTKTLRELFFDRVDLFIEARELKETEPSTVVDVTGEPKIVRGGCKETEVEEALTRFSQERSSYERSV